jgi:alkylation response protein AidB-like acyl-CoA dehydrogenase
MDEGAKLIERARGLGPLLREYAEAAERERRLPRAVHEALAGAGLYRMFLPRSLGGLELDPLTVARVIEEVARFDSAAAWSLQSPSLQGFVSRDLPEAGVQELYGSGPDLMIAAAFHPPQQAIEAAGGYRVSGKAPLASGIRDSQWALFTALIFDDGQPRMTEHGPVMIAFIVRTSEVEILDTWHSLGMRGTDSADVAFRDVFVPAHRTFVVAPGQEPNPHFRGRLYQFPMVPIVGLFSASVLLAAARVALDEVRELAQRKTPFGSMKPLRERASAQIAYAEGEATLRAARALFHGALADGWARTLAGEEQTLEQKADLTLAVVHAVKSATRVVEAMHRVAGTTGIYTRSRLERCFRDAHTLRQHGFASESRLENVGQVYFGAPCEFPLLVF